MIAPYYDQLGVTVYHGDCLDVMRELPDSSVHAVVCDPPYGLEFMSKEWDRFAGKVSDRDFKGFILSQQWIKSFILSQQRTRNVKCVDCKRWAYDHPGRLCECGGIRRAQTTAFQTSCEQWAAECRRVVKPGGHLVAFGGTRTWHRLVCAIEDAGFEIRDSIAWLYGSGFPKSLDVSKAIDKTRHDDVTHVTAFLRAARGDRPLREAVNHLGFDSKQGTYGVAAFFAGDPTKARVPTITQWASLRDLYGFDNSLDAEVQRLNARKGTPGHDRDRQAPQQRVRTSAAIAASGFGVDGWAPWVNEPSTDDARQWQGWGTALKPAHEPIVVARKPLVGTVAGNVLEHGTGALNIDGCRTSTEPRSTGTVRPHAVSGVHGTYGRDLRTDRQQRYDAHKPAGRWPPNVVLTHAALLDLDNGEPIGDACAAGCVDGCPVLELDRQSGIRTPARNEGASRFFPTFRWEAKAPPAERPRVNGVAHPTVKPLALMRWLVRLVTPPGGTVLDPFAGSGTTGQATRAEGFQAILVEQDESYLPLIRQRLDGEHEALFFDGEVS